jgi:hypothetical protein
VRTKPSTLEPLGGYNPQNNHNSRISQKSTSKRQRKNGMAPKEINNKGGSQEANTKRFLKGSWARFGGSHL